MIWPRKMLETRERMYWLAKRLERIESDSDVRPPTLKAQDKLHAALQKMGEAIDAMQCSLNERNKGYLPKALNLFEYKPEKPTAGWWEWDEEADTIDCKLPTYKGYWIKRDRLKATPRPFDSEHDWILHLAEKEGVISDECLGQFVRFILDLRYYTDHQKREAK